MQVCQQKEVALTAVKKISRLQWIIWWDVQLKNALEGQKAVNKYLADVQDKCTNLIGEILISRRTLQI